MPQLLRPPGNPGTREARPSFRTARVLVLLENGQEIARLQGDAESVRIFREFLRDVDYPWQDVACDRYAKASRLNPDADRIEEIALAKYAKGDRDYPTQTAQECARQGMRELPRSPKPSGFAFA